MKKYISLLAIIVITVFVIGGASFLYKKLEKDYNQIAIVNKEKEENIEYKKATDFVVLDYNGNQVKLSDFIGKPIVVNFWATWCPPCKAELPSFDKLYEEKKDEIEFLMVNLTDGVSDTTETVKTFISQSGYKFPVYFDVNGEAAYSYNLYSIPRTIFIDRYGNLISSYSGAISEVNLRKNIDKILNK